MPANPSFARLGIRRCLKWLPSALLATLLWAASPQPACADETPTWDPVVPADLAGTQSAAYPDAPAEVLSWKLEVDDRNLNNGERKINEYIRYKIYDPARAEDVTRITAIDATVENLRISEVEIHGRLILPDGTIREVGKDSIRERSLQRRGSEDTLAQRLIGNAGVVADEKFVAVEGLQAGAVLEFQILTTFSHGASRSFSGNLQKVSIPVRHLDCTVRLYQGEELNGSALIGNPGALHVSQSFDRPHAALHVTADNLPPLVDEPFSPSVSSRSVTLFAFEDATHIANRHPGLNPALATPSDGPWAPVAAKVSLIEEDATMYPPDPVISRARELVKGAASETEKARKIHDFIHALYVKFTLSPAGSREHIQRYASSPLEWVMDFDQHLNQAISTDDFIWLELAMDRGVGLEARTVLLPNRRVMPFNIRLPSPLFMQMPAAQVRVDGAWQFSMTAVSDLLPFGWLPWQYQNGAALVAKEGKQEFVAVLPEPALKSTIENTGDFTLGPDGSLAGHARRRLTGEPAIIRRPRPRDSSVARFTQSVARSLKAEFPAATVTVTKVAGLNDPEKPLEFEYDLQWPGYATETKTRLIFRPSVINGQSHSPFAAAERKNAVEFPFHWREIDDLSLQLPDGYSLETPSAPAPVVVPNALSYKTEIGRTAKSNQIHLRREFVSDVSSVPVGAYPTLKRWYDLVEQSDLHELVLAKASPSAAPAPAVAQ